MTREELTQLTKKQINDAMQFNLNLGGYSAATLDKMKKDTLINEYLTVQEAQLKRKNNSKPGEKKRRSSEEKEKILKDLREELNEHFQSSIVSIKPVFSHGKQVIWKILLTNKKRINILPRLDGKFTIYLNKEKFVYQDLQETLAAVKTAGEASEVSEASQSDEF